MICILVNSGKACHRQAIKPAMFGLEKEVPFPELAFTDVLEMIVPWPTETILG